MGSRKNSAENNAAEEAPEDPPVVKKLKEICDRYRDIELEFEKKVEELTAEYTAKQKPLLEERKQVLVSTDETSPDTGTPALHGFWLKAMQKHPAFEDVIQEWDEPVLEYLQDVTTEVLDPEDSNKGFEVTFHFIPNPYFENTKLKKVYITHRPNLYLGEVEPKEIKADTIKWFAGKDVTVEKVQKKVKGGGAKKAKQKKEKEEARASFFRDFFRNLTPDTELPEDAREQARAMNEDDDDDDDDDEDLVMYLMENDLEIGQCLRDNLVPWAIRWYTGEAAPDDDDDEDEEEEEELTDESETESDPRGKRRGRGPPPKKGGSGGKKPTPKTSPEQKPKDAPKEPPKEECKQQ